MKKTILFALILIALMSVFGCSQAEDNGQDSTTIVQQTPTTQQVVPTTQSDPTTTQASVTTTQETTITQTAEVKTFSLTGINLKFMMDGVEAPEIRVNEGDTVRIEFTSTDGFHDWVVDEFDAATERVNTGNSTFVEFIADKKGTFEYYCSVGQHRANGMRGNLVVE
ncbi:MAG: cupredoxin domain-containing protein [Candidatus Woesearchaeota archaeon]